MLLQLGASTGNVRWPKKSLIGIKNPYSDKASFFLVETSISTISRLQIDLSLFYPNGKMVKFGTICLEKNQLMFCSLENRYSDTYLRPFHSIWSGNLQPATNNYTMDLAFQQRKHRAATFASQNDVKQCHHNFRGAKHRDFNGVS